MASTTTNIPTEPFAGTFRVSERMTRFWTMFMLTRERSALLQAQHHVSKPDIFNKRIAEVNAELKAMRKK